MNIDTIIREIVNRAIPLNQTCQIERTKEIERRARLRLDIEELLREKRPQVYEPRSEFKDMPDRITQQSTPTIHY